MVINEHLPSRFDLIDTEFSILNSVVSRIYVGEKGVSVSGYTNKLIEISLSERIGLVDYEISLIVDQIDRLMES